MKIKKVQGGYYLLVKISARDRKYLDDFRKYESPGIVKNTDTFLQKMLELHIKSVFLMQTALLREASGKVRSSTVNMIFNKLDLSLQRYVAVIHKYTKLFAKKRKRKK